MDGPGHRFGIKGLQIFEGAAATGQDDNIRAVSFFYDIKCFYDFLCCGVTLDLYRKNVDLQVRETALKDGEHVVNDRAGGRGDQGDAPGQKRQLFFLVGMEKAFFFKSAFKLLEGYLEGADAFRFQVFEDDLIRTPGFVQADTAESKDLHAVFRHKFEVPVLAFEDDRLNLGLVVFERKIKMPGRRHPEI
jgi:hypothetical protein